MLKHSVTTLIIILVYINNSEYVTMAITSRLGRNRHHIIAVPKIIIHCFYNFVNRETSKVYYIILLEERNQRQEPIFIEL